jgi:Na+-transporting NADH:ubiquinone oxidoreductase subunit D
MSDDFEGPFDGVRAPSEVEGIEDAWRTGPEASPRARTMLLDGLLRSNPLAAGMLGICSALAVTTRLETALVMSLAVTFVCTASGLTISLVRGLTPRRFRLITQICLIGTFVILVDRLTGALAPAVSREIGPYMGLIITNCIILARAEAFASKNAPLLSAVDGFANALGYSVVLCLVAVTREVLGTGRIAVTCLSASPVVLVSLGPRYLPNDFLLLASGAFIALGFLVALFRHCSPRRRTRA